MHAEQPQAPIVENDPAAEAAPIAIVEGNRLVELPHDLYIPPDALEVFLDAFEGPLDLLLYLIRRQNLDILDIPIAEITAQYMQYIALLGSARFELAAEYLLMAAMLAEIKSRMLLPRVVEASEDDEEDPRAELVRRLQEYERFREAAERLDELPRLERDVHRLSAPPPAIERIRPEPEVRLDELLVAMREVMERARLNERQAVFREALSVRARMTRVLEQLRADDFTEFGALFDAEEGRLGIVVTFIAVLELCRESLVELVQSEPFAPIWLRPAGSKRADTTVAAPPAVAELG